MLTGARGVSKASWTILRRHIVSSVGGRSATCVVAILVAIAVISYNVMAYGFLSHFLPVASLSRASRVQIAEVLTAAQVSSAGGAAVLVRVFAPRHSALRIAVQVLSASRFDARIGESMPYLVVLCCASFSMSIGPAAYLTNVIGRGASPVIELAAVAISTSFGVTLVAEATEMLLRRFEPSVVQLLSVIVMTGVLGLLVANSVSAARVGAPSLADQWVRATTGQRKVDGSVLGVAFAIASAVCLGAAIIAVRVFQAYEPAGRALRVVTFGRWAPRVLKGSFRELTMAVRQPIGQVSLVVSMSAVCMVGLAARTSILPDQTALLLAGMLAAAPLELSWARVAPWVWLYRYNGTSAARIVLEQLCAGACLAVVATGVFVASIGHVPGLDLLAHHAVVLCMVMAVAYLAGTVAPASAESPASVAITSVLAISCESLVMWGAAKIDEAAPGLGVLVFAIVAVASAILSALRIGRRLQVC